ncbi:MAG TPA: hypothetical protein DEP01_01765 [Aminobacterium sp.]|uniref:hypothetical protein n=1 Tax=Aminobacterium TaxID=81466 RepID=UPI00046716A3|nr:MULTISPECIES: hypothetical protein [Aminobacterium]HCA40346.1 hypothetical protein [Aminobacterium sp.]
MKGLEDLLLFGKVISTALLIAGYIFLGYWIGRWLFSRGYPDTVIIGCTLLGAIIGLWQGWLYLKQIWRKNKRKR